LSAPHRTLITNVMQGLKTRRSPLPSYCTRGKNWQDRFSVLQFLNSAVAYEFAITCKVVTLSWCLLVYLI